MIGIDKVAEALFALRSEDGWKVGNYSVRMPHPSVSIDVRFRPAEVTIKFPEGAVLVDHSNWLADSLVDGELYAITISSLGKSKAFVEVTLPMGRKKDIEVAL